MPSDSPFFLLFFFFFFSTAFDLLSVGSATIEDGEGEGIGSRTLLGLKETPHGTNSTFECSPNGPCVPCQYSEKNNEKYRCSETGYRIPLKCVEIKQGLKDAKAKIGPKKSRSTLEVSHNISELHNAEELSTLLKRRSLLDDDDSSTEENGKQAYITYRSCIPPVNEEKLSVLGFEVIVLCLLVISGSIVYFKKRQTATMAGFSRIQSNARF
ncbi:hypothetical protein RchiOBHm_Chr4g0444991 [Rosa chinensis]|uniref:Structural polyprotein n=1 Tax=Rosa chinensis TaxID=74649 RepID=A0A2P6R499_ROSCH|nr:uncharacterized protein LOC112197292 [Rosa chinensis]PRQ41261.1 hypothetical protein RchiOBHm_Chr4g0444991 [Rosa chinensis]